MLIAVLYAVPALIALLPSWLAGALVPALMVGQRLLLNEEERLSVGSLGIYPLDILIALLVIKWLVTGGLARVGAVDRNVLHALWAWAVVNLLATLSAGVKFGETHTLSCLVLLARGLADAALLLVVADAITSLRQARTATVVVLLFLGGLIAIQFINFAGASRGFMIGEVQGLDRGEPRIFGPVGDSVGFVLLLGYLYGLCRENLLIAASFAGGILITAGLGAIFGLAVATGLYLLGKRHVAPSVLTFTERGLRLFVGFGAVGGAALLFAGPMTETLRLRLDGAHEESGEQRLTTARLAVATIEDNLLTGVGYMGFRSVVGRYGGRDFFDLDRPDGATANANNQVLQSLSDAGVVGLFCLAMLVFTTARLLYRATLRTSDPLLKSFLGAALLWLLTQAFGNLAATWLTPSSFVAILLWISGGIGAAVDRLALEVEEAPSACAEQTDPIDEMELLSV